MIYSYLMLILFSFSLFLSFSVPTLLFLSHTILMWWTGLLLARVNFHFKSLHSAFINGFKIIYYFYPLSLKLFSSNKLSLSLFIRLRALPLYLSASPSLASSSIRSLSFGGCYCFAIVVLIVGCYCGGQLINDYFLLLCSVGSYSRIYNIFMISLSDANGSERRAVR